jgi:hypothetical protein
MKKPSIISQNQEIIHLEGELFRVKGERNKLEKDIVRLRRLLGDVWDAWSETNNANDPDCDGYQILQKCKKEGSV